MAAPVRFAAYTKEGWEAFVNGEKKPAPASLTWPEYRKLSLAARSEYDRNRMAAHRVLGPYALGQVKTIMSELLELIEENDEHPDHHIRRAAAVDGLPSLGKTTILRLIGRSYARRMRDRYGYETEAGDE
jgi:hypothetical protein